MRVRAKMAELEKDFPPGIEFMIRYDTTPYIRESIYEVFKTLREAVILVAIVVLLFLQNWRSAVIPLIAVPVAIIGTFGVMAAMGFSLNNLTLFGLVLADRHRGRRRDRGGRGGRAPHRARDGAARRDDPGHGRGRRAR